MRALVTGGAGFIGSHIVDALLKRHYRVRIVDALDPVVHAGGMPSYVPDNVEVLSGDVRNPELMSRALADVDVVFHEAARQGFLPEFSRFFDVNTVGTALIFETIVAQRLPVRKVVVASSQAVYGEGKYYCPSCDRIEFPGPRDEARLLRSEWEVPCPTCGTDLRWRHTDEATVKPFTQYALSKYTQEMVALNFGRRYGIPSVALRYSITQGPRQSFKNAYSGILRIFSLRYLQGLTPVIYEDGRMQRDYVHIDDVVEANMVVLDSSEADFRAFNVGSGVATTQIEYAEKLAAHLKVDPVYSVPGEFRYGDVRHIVSDVSGLCALGWRVTKSLDEIIADYVAWLGERTDLADYFEDAAQAMKAVGAVRQALA
ncbi:NAD-dependent epimerase/dehydratase family protein [Candidatus Poribacteria bacterium]|nr:NAD-dependent epimerase/dehydratase family protein [Candidatus Poribacteria bacterium]